jgi:hypothetical protein
MSSWARNVATKYLNVGTPLVLMGALWLYLWLFPWYGYYVSDPHWGHNYAEALAFLAVGLAYFCRRLISDLLALLAALIIIPASLELLPHTVTAIANGIFVALIVVDWFVERKREQDLGQPRSKRFFFWLKKHIPRFSYIMLGHLPLIYYLVRLPSGTYETDLVTKVYDAMVVPFVILALLEEPVSSLGPLSTPKLGFFWGMLTMIISLILLFHQPETWICMAITVAVTVIGIVAMVVEHRSIATAA